MATRICAEIVRRYADRMSRVYALHNGGEIRAARGDVVESLLQDCCELIGLEYRKGTTDYQTITVGEFSKKHQVDGHIYRDGSPILFVECKAYLDSCYYARACDDFKLMKLRHPAVPCVLISLENSIADDTFAFRNAVDGGVCSKVFYLCEGKRSSTRPLYQREFEKPIQVESLVEYLQSVSG